MGYSKSFALIPIVILAVSILIMAKPVFAQTPTPTPSAPAFTLQLVGPSYTVPTTYSLNPNTGQVVAQIGYTNAYSYVEVTIKNQPLVFDYSNVHLIGAFGFYYNIQIKSHNSTNWSGPYSPSDDDFLSSIKFGIHKRNNFYTGSNGSSEFGWC